MQCLFLSILTYSSNLPINHSCKLSLRQWVLCLTNRPANTKDRVSGRAKLQKFYGQFLRIPINLPGILASSCETERQQIKLQDRLPLLLHVCIKPPILISQHNRRNTNITKLKCYTSSVANEPTNQWAAAPNIHLRPHQYHPTIPVWPNRDFFVLHELCIPTLSKYYTETRGVTIRQYGRMRKRRFAMRHCCRKKEVFLFILMVGTTTEHIAIDMKLFSIQPSIYPRLLKQSKTAHGNIYRLWYSTICQKSSMVILLFMF